MRRRESDRCVYCGRIFDAGTEKTDDHVFPKNLYPVPRRSDWDPIIVPACEDCNRKWSDAEEHFRNVVDSAGFNLASEELYLDKIQRGLRRPESKGRIRDLLSMSEAFEVDGKTRLRIYPARDARVLNVIRKIVVGLCHHHEISTALSMERIRADVLRFRVPAEDLARLQYEQREADIVEYWYGVRTEAGVHSVWLFRFFESIGFIAVVSESEDGTFPWEANLDPRGKGET